MFKNFFLFLFVAAASALSANPAANDLPKISTAQAVKNELGQLDDVIAATQRSLEQQKKLKDLLVKYQEAQRDYLKNENDVELLYRMIKLAHRAMASIQENHLTYTFNQEFLNELNLFAQMANKRSQ